MMLKQISLAALVLCVCSTAHAQFGFGGGGQRIQRPLGNQTVSPYVNLLRGGGGAGLNYFGIVRPEQQLGASLQQLQGGLGGNARQANQRRGGIGLGGVGTTGHPVVFDSFRRVGGAGGGGLGGGLGIGGGGGNFQPGFLGQGAGGTFGGFNVGGGGGSSFSPINNGALNAGGGVFGGAGGAFGGGGGGGGGALLAGGGGGGGRGGGGGAAGGGGGNVGGVGGRRTPWGVGVPIFSASLGSTGHPAQFDTFRRNAAFGQ